MSPHEKLARAFMSAGGSATLSGSPTVGADSRRRALGEKDPNVRLSPPKTLKTRRTSDATVDLETAAPTFGLEDIKVSKDRKNLQGLASQPAPACVPSFELEPTPRAVKQPRALTHASNQQHDGVKRKIDVGEDTDDERPVLKRLRVDIDGRQQLMAGKNDLRSDATQPEVSPHSTQEISARASDEVKGSKICVSSDPEALGPLQDETMSQSSNAPTSSSGKSHAETLRITLRRAMAKLEVTKSTRHPSQSGDTRSKARPNIVFSGPHPKRLPAPLVQLSRRRCTSSDSRSRSVGDSGDIEQHSSSSPFLRDASFISGHDAEPGVWQGTGLLIPSYNDRFERHRTASLSRHASDVLDAEPPSAHSVHPESSSERPKLGYIAEPELTSSVVKDRAAQSLLSLGLE